MQRRKFLGITIATAGLLGLGGWLFRLNTRRKNESLWTPSELAKICSREKLMELGREYRLLYTGFDAEAMEVKIFEGHDANLQSREEYLKWKSEADFQTGDTLLISGWFLSRTEAQQCALLSLSIE